MSFLKHQGATLYVAGLNIRLGNSELPLVNYKTISLPARTRTLVEIPLKENDLLQEYVKKINADPAIFIGETVVTSS